MQYRAWLVAVVFSLSACARPQQNSPSAGSTNSNEHAAHHPAMGPTKEGGGMMGGGMMNGAKMHAMCPAAVPGTATQAEDVEGGAALSFKTTGDVAELRRRVVRMAEMHNRHHPTGDGKTVPMGGMMGGGMMGGMMGGGMMGGMMPQSQARSEDIEGGARLVFTPQKSEDLQALRDKVKQAAASMASHQCPMMKRDNTVAEQTSP